MDTLTNEDFEMLLKALDALKSKAENDGLLTGLMGSLLLSQKSESEAEAFLDKTMNAAHEKSRKIEETIILLKAKLITIRDSAVVSDAVQFMTRK